MRHSLFIILFCLLLLPGCQWMRPLAATQGYPNAHPQAVYQPGQPVQSQPGAQALGRRATGFLGDIATGFTRAAVGGAGFSAGRDLWNKIAR